MRQWYYIDEQLQQIETDEAGIRRLAETGELRPDVLVWNDSLTEWLPLKRAISASPPPEVPEDETGTLIPAYRAPLGGPSESNIRSLASALARNAGWARFLGIVSLLCGIATLPFLLLGVFPIWMGITLFQIASRAENAKQTGREAALTGALEKTALFFKANAVFLLVLAILGMTIAVFVALGGYAVLTAAFHQAWKLFEASRQDL